MLPCSKTFSGCLHPTARPSASCQRLSGDQVLGRKQLSSQPQGSRPLRIQELGEKTSFAACHAVPSPDVDEASTSTTLSESDIPGRRRRGQITLAHPQYSRIASMWHPSLNAGKRPKDFSHRGAKTVHLQCKGCRFCGEIHSWSAKCIDLTQYGGSIVCPYCDSRGGKFCACRSIARTPHLLAEWDPSNGDPESFSRATGKKLGWICSRCRHSFAARGSDRFVEGSGCPMCARSNRAAAGMLTDVRPDLAEEWAHDLNDRPLEGVTCGSHTQAWWRCRECRHTWLARVFSRARAGSGCPQSTCMASNRGGPRLHATDFREANGRQQAEPA